MKLRCILANNIEWRVCSRKFKGGLPRIPGGRGVDYRQDFFGRPAYLTVSGQLQVTTSASLHVHRRHGYAGHTSAEKSGCCPGGFGQVGSAW